KPPFSASRTSWNEGLVDCDGKARHRRDKTDETSGSRMGAGEASSRRCDCQLRQWHDSYLVGPSCQSPQGPDAYAFGKSGDYGTWAAVYDCRADCISPETVRSVCW